MRADQDCVFLSQAGSLLCVPESELGDCNDNDKDVGDECKVLGENSNLLQGTCAMFEESVSQQVRQRLEFREEECQANHCPSSRIRTLCTAPSYHSAIRLPFRK